MSNTSKHFFLGYEPSKSPVYEKTTMLLVMKIAIPFALVYSIVNALFGYYLLSAVLGIVALMLIACFVLERKGCCVQLSRNILMLAAGLVFSVLAIDGGIGQTGIYWALLFPFLAFMLMGVRIGWLCIGTFLLVLIAAYNLFYFDFLLLPYSRDTLILFPSMFLLFTLIGNVFELQNEKHRVTLNRMNEDLEINAKALHDSYTDMEQLVVNRTRELQEVNTQLVVEVQQKTQALESKQQTEMKFQHAQRMEAVGTLVGGIAHDFNNMLSGITANLYMAQRQMESEDGKQRLKKIGDLSMLAADMIKQLLTFARKDEAEMKHFDLTVFINEAYKLARVSIPENILCSFHFGKDKLFINGNATQIQQILMNLMNNARDALVGAESPAITVSLSEFEADDAFLSLRPELTARHYGRLSVQDNGMGITKDKQKRIFDPFFTTKEVGKGTGLGLAMVYGAMQSHQGLIEVESEVGSGTCFTLYFPLLEEVANTTGDAKKQQVVQGNGELILVVDDDQRLCECEYELLQKMGYRALTACNGIEALRLFEQHRHEISLVLMDVVMPVLGGVASANRIQKLEPSAKIIFMTGYDKDQDMASELMPDYEHILHKPIDVEELSVAIRRAIEV